ncbi:MAG: GNAT family N-acetyltransferase [Micrococcales bacterium]|nr:GNAT family N-acetyltransferase [Micrococcales bacterium]
MTAPTPSLPPDPGDSNTGFAAAHERPESNDAKAVVGRETSQPAPRGGIQVRLADGNDLEGVVAVGRATWPITHGEFYDPDLVELFLAKWWTSEATIPAIRAGRTVVAESLDHLDENGKPQIVGMAAYGGHQGAQVIWKLYVLPQWQRHGIGGMLLRAVFSRIGDQPIHMSFPDGNRAAGDFSRAYGFVEDHREEQHDMPDLVWMRRDPAIGSIVLRRAPR